jgi:anti-sigma factor RsiW
MDEPRDIELIDYLTGSLSAEDRRRVEEAIEALPHVKCRYEELRAAWNLLFEAAVSPTATDAWPAIAARLRETPADAGSPGKLRLWPRVAAAILIGALAGHGGGRLALPWLTPSAESVSTLVAVEESDVSSELGLQALCAGPIHAFDGATPSNPETTEEES